MSFHCCYLEMQKKEKKWDMVIPDLCHQQGFCNGMFFDVIRLWVDIHDVYIQSSFIYILPNHNSSYVKVAFLPQGKDPTVIQKQP